MTPALWLRWAYRSRLVALPRCVFHNFLGDHGLQLAAGLAYTSLLSLVPLMAVMIGLFSVFPAFDRVTTDIQDFIFQNFVPASGEVVQSYLQAFASKARGLTAIGTVVLVVTSVMLISSINAAMNRIWKVQHHRSLIGRVLVYWALLTLGPLLIGASLVATSYLVSLPLFRGVSPDGTRGLVLTLLPWLSAAVGFTLMYTIVPDTRVRIRDALLGGVVAAVLFEIAKGGFAFYVTRFPTYQTIYGALAAVPLFLVWIYVTWVIILLGAECSCCAGRPNWTRDQPKSMGFVSTLDLLRRLRERQREGRTLDLRGRDGWSLGLPQVELETILLSLRRARIIHRTEDQTWALSRDLDDLTLQELQRITPFKLPTVAELSEAPSWVAPFVAVLADAESRLSPVLDRTIADVLET